MEYHPKFALLLKQYLDQRERKAVWLARQLGLSSSTVSRWLLDATRPGTPEVVGQIADLLGLHDAVARGELMQAAGYALLSRADDSCEVEAPLDPSATSDPQADRLQPRFVKFDSRPEAAHKYNIQVKDSPGTVIGDQQEVKQVFNL